MLPIETGQNNPILRQKSVPVEKFDKKFKTFIKEMEETLVEAKGLGLAAPQVGVNKRIFLVKIKDSIIPMINPEIISFSDENVIDEEGCLSLPNIWGQVERPQDVTVRYFDINGKPKTLKLSGLEAREVFHEYDHIEGILFTDKLIPPNFSNLPQENDEVSP